MKLEILGCSGGIGKGLKTTSFLLDDKILVDAGTGLELLSLEQMLAIETIVITHAHLDHIAGLPLMLATIYDKHRHPIKVYASDVVISALKQHIFNWTIWPDYTQLPEQTPIVELCLFEVGEELYLPPYKINALPSEHPTPTQGYFISDGSRSFAFTGDTGQNPHLWPILNTLKPDLLIIDVSFIDELQELAKVSGHLTPSQLKTELKELDFMCQIRITHLKPGFEQIIQASCQALMPNTSVSALNHNEVIVI